MNMETKPNAHTPAGRRLNIFGLVWVSGDMMSNHRGNSGTVALITLIQSKILERV
jgi:hypothetical protein